MLEEMRIAAVQRLLAQRHAEGHWVGELSGSALSTATAVCALELHRRESESSSASDLSMIDGLVGKGLAWLREYQNADGGWGDTIDSPSNISTTVLCWAALGIRRADRDLGEEVLSHCERWLTGRVGTLTPARLGRAICDAYGVDRTFSAPILTMCVLAGRFDDAEDAWEHVPSLPFELALVPHRWYHKIGLPVVSYALPALIAIGQARHYHRPTRNPLARLARHMAREKTLAALLPMQPASGGYLEAAPLTSFVVMSLVSIGQADHPVAKSGIRFLVNSARPDGCWPIDSNLATWTTTLAVGALSAGPAGGDSLSRKDQRAIAAWLLDQQHMQIHPYTHSPPGGWAWTDLSGGVPDGDDTPGVLLALWRFHRDEDDVERRARIFQAALDAVQWLLDLQNKDGGIPTFCPGWGKLPFDQSSPDLTAHTLRAWTVWRRAMPKALQPRLNRAMNAAIGFLVRSQKSDGTWVPLWFGNQGTTNLENPLYGTARVLLAAKCLARDADMKKRWEDSLSMARTWLLSAQNDDGGWGGDAGVTPTIEETALALEALAESVASIADGDLPSECQDLERAIVRGVRWLHRATAGGTRFPTSPIGLYFAKLWYSEKLYPVLFTVAALQRVSRLCSGTVSDTFSKSLGVQAT
ncbi:MAG: squalene--hopene cyclase [Planctomycetes bacterium]|nr:squalene--hopene cyclase [Planctomycetota bacterium]